ncbi:hypothetical protein RJ639_038362 [Escallonia herrerae]|uniref:Cw7 protein n=1 Tax=Escallonia herrerae TaxID=1293975 RepID=A0AA89B5H1_9ASTE|nr:hypothetical protein RJ639_038362 [Escallonia herrerae]
MIFCDRFELLSMVKKHSNLLGKTVVEEEDASDIEMDQQFWRDVMDLYFVSGRESRGRQDDDLVFFVRKMSLHGYGFNDNLEGNSPYFVRRWASKLDNLVDEISVSVDWRRSYYLNLIAHTTYTVTVAICSHQVLRNHQSGQDTPLSPIYKVVKTVFASASRVDFHLDSRKASDLLLARLCFFFYQLYLLKFDVTLLLICMQELETTPAYPEICFAVDDFDSTFDAVVLTDTDHCYRVLLNAHGGAAFPSEKTSEDCLSNDKSLLKIVTDAEKTKKSKEKKAVNLFWHYQVLLFSQDLSAIKWFEKHMMSHGGLDIWAGKSGLGSLLSLGHSPGKTDRLYMKGPGGRGEVEVAVSGVIDQSMGEPGPHSPLQTSKRGFGLGTIVRRAASVASVAAKHAFAAAASTHSSDEEMLPLKCCLMSISLPWEHIAYDLLFKGAPPVNL